MSEYKRCVDEQMLFAQAQLSALENIKEGSGEHPHVSLAFLQAAILQLVMALRAYVQEITEGQATQHGGLAILEGEIVPGYDFRLREMRELKGKPSWLETLLQYHAQILRFTRTDNKVPTNIIASSEMLTGPSMARDWRDTGCKELYDTLRCFKAMIQNHRDMAQEY